MFKNIILNSIVFTALVIAISSAVIAAVSLAFNRPSVDTVGLASLAVAMGAVTIPASYELCFNSSETVW